MKRDAENDVPPRIEKSHITHLYTVHALYTISRNSPRNKTGTIGGLGILNASVDKDKGFFLQLSTLLA